MNDVHPNWKNPHGPQFRTNKKRTYRSHEWKDRGELKEKIVKKIRNGKWQLGRWDVVVFGGSRNMERYRFSKEELEEELQWGW